MVTFKKKNASELLNVLSLHKILCEFLTRCIDALMELCVELSENCKGDAVLRCFIAPGRNVKVESVYCQTFQFFFANPESVIPLSSCAIMHIVSCAVHG